MVLEIQLSMICFVYRLEVYFWPPGALGLHHLKNMILSLEIGTSKSDTVLQIDMKLADIWNQVQKNIDRRWMQAHMTNIVMHFLHDSTFDFEIVIVASVIGREWVKCLHSYSDLYIISSTRYILSQRRCRTKPIHSHSQYKSILLNFDFSLFPGLFKSYLFVYKFFLSMDCTGFLFRSSWGRSCCIPSSTSILHDIQSAETFFLWLCFFWYLMPEYFIS